MTFFARALPSSALRYAQDTVSPRRGEKVPKADEGRCKLQKTIMITATHLTRRFCTKTALEDISPRIESGEFFGLIGPDRAGKTTFFRIVARVLEPTSGSVAVEQSAVELGVTFGFV